ncbi:MAG: class B sortase [Ruminiclostridium sp.]|nr:class B sortase [Ruminiclostridium sp.]
MAGFAKRPHRKHPDGHTEKSYEMPEDKDTEDIGSYIGTSYYDNDDDDDDTPDTRRTRSKKLVYDDDDDDYYDSRRPKKPNFFVRALHAIFPVKGDGIAESVRKIIFDVAVVAFVITGGSVVYSIIDEGNQGNIDIKVAEIYKPIVQESESVEEVREKIKGELNLTDSDLDKIEAEKPGILPDFLGLYSQNRDIVGWVKLGSKTDPIVNINYPVMQADDNDYYLTHNFFRDETQRGAIFADYRNKFSFGELSGNTILYGHNMWNGDTMFAKLSRYYTPNVMTDPDAYKKDPLLFYKEHPTVTFNTLYENAEWKVFACVLFNTQEELGEVYPYLNYRDFPNKATFNAFILDIMDRSVLWTDVDLQYGDSILTLSTCHYPYGKEKADTRVAIFARKVRDGESAEVDVSKAVRNPDPLKFAYQYRVEGGSWGGRKWDSSKLLSYKGE